MDMEGIRKRVGDSKDRNAIDAVMNKIQTTIQKYPNGYDLQVSPYIILSVEIQCDSLNIPCYIVAEETLSVASSYEALYAHERQR